MSRGLVAAALAAIVALVIPSPPDATATHRCREAGSTTIVKSKTARIYRSRRKYRRVYGCLYRTGKRVPLTDAFDGESLSETSLTELKPRLAGRFVGFEYGWDNGVAGGPGLAVVDLRSGDVRGFDLDPSTEDDHPDVSVSDMVVTTRGSMAWTWTAEYGDGRTVREVRKLESDADSEKFGVILDSGPDVDLVSLERRGSSVSWLKAGVRASAPLR